MQTRQLVAIFALLLAAPSIWASTFQKGELHRAAYSDAAIVGKLANRRISEASGMAASRRDTDILWAINDSGNSAELFALTVAGADRGTLGIRDVPNRDWEDLASFRLDGQPYLAIAETGDNNAKHKRSRIYVVPEPEITEQGLPPSAETSPAWTLTFKFEHGPRDCESVAVDVQQERILLLTKRTVPPELYELPLRPPENAGSALSARFVGKVMQIPSPTTQQILEDRTFGAFLSQPTGMDISPDGTRAVVLTYRRAYEFVRIDNESWIQAFSRRPGRIDFPRLRQAEAIAYDMDGQRLFITSEKRPSPLIRLDRTPSVAR